MKILTECICRTISTFGIVASLTTLIYTAVFGDSLKHDDSYILGGIIASIVCLIFIPNIMVSTIWNKTFGLVSSAILYSAITAYSIYVTQTAELHGPGIALVILLGSLIFGSFEQFVLRKIKLRYLSPVGFVLAFAFIGAIKWTQY